MCATAVTEAGCVTSQAFVAFGLRGRREAVLAADGTQIRQPAAATELNRAV